MSSALSLVRETSVLRIREGAGLFGSRISTREHKTSSQTEA
jgi:hypothetical protein